MPSTTYDVFLSYLSPDRDAVTRIAAGLRRANLRPWFDVWDLPDGQRLHGELAAGIEMSTAFVFFVGPSGVDPLKRWSGEELDFALEHQKRNPGFLILSVILPGAPDPATTNAVPPFFRSRPWIDFRGGLDDREAFRRLVETLRRPAGHNERGRGVSGQQPSPPGPDRHDGSRRPAVAPPPPPPHRQPGAPARQPARAGALYGEIAVTSSTLGGGLRVDGFSSRPVAPISHLRTNAHLIQDPIANRTFTPLIGAGCSLVGRSQSDAWARIASRMEHLIDVLGSDGQAAMYVRALASSSPYDVILYGPMSGDIDDARQDDLLLDLQVALARLGAHLGRLFATSMVNTTTPVWDAVAYRLPIDPEDPSLLEVCRWSVLACVAAHKLKSMREARDANVGLGASGIYDRLVELTAHFDHDSQLTRGALRSSDPHLAQVYDDVFSDIRGARNREHAEELVGLTAGGYLSLHELEWVADALWHTLRYDQAAYPRADEFAFQVSLFATGASGRRPEKEGAFEAARSRLSSGTVATWFHQYSGTPSNRMLAFYGALARVLAAEYQSRRTAGDGGRDGLGSIMPLDPIAFSTNFDLEMERALQECDEVSTFHVVVPVYAYLDLNSEPEVRWMIGKTTKQTSVESPQWTWFPDSERPKPSSIQGPILIKLNGSPLHELPSPGEIGGPDSFAPDFERFEHALILSETEHLQHIVWRDPLPIFGETVLQQKDRTLVFLGHSIKEWSTRLRMFTQIHRPNKAPVNRRESRMLAINRSHDPFRSAILGSIGVHRLVGDLDEFTRLVDDILE